jgi:hypothetical protein
MPRRLPTRPGAEPARRAAAAVAALIVAVLTAGCGVRLESPPPDLPSPDAAEAARQGAASRAQAVALLAEAAVPAADAEVAGALGRVAADARTHVEELGGVWAPPAWATATPGPTPSGGAGTPSSTPPQGASAADVVADLAASAEITCADALAAGPADLAALLASMCLAQTGAAQDLAAAARLAAPATPTALAPADDPGALPEALLHEVGAAPGAAALGRALDAAGFALEVTAARTPGTQRGELADLAEAHRIEGRAVLAAAGVLGGTDDPRRAAYDLPDGMDTDPDAVVAVVEGDVLEAWTSIVGLVGGEARAGALAEMAAAADRARAGGGAPSPLPGLPTG